LSINSSPLAFPTLSVFILSATHQRTSPCITRRALRIPHPQPVRISHLFRAAAPFLFPPFPTLPPHS
jgi:hypothetical protein